MQYPKIESAIATGGKLGVYAPMDGKHIFRAVMEWHDGRTIMSTACMGMDNCLANLEDELTSPTEAQS